MSAVVVATSTTLPYVAKEDATPTPEPIDCLKSPVSQQWLRDVKNLLEVWRDETDVVMQVSRTTAAEASRELRNTRRQLRQMDTPSCLIPVRDQLLYQMTGGLASLDAWIQRNGNGWVFAAVAELQVDDFLDFASAESEVHESCEASLDAEWIRSITERLSEWQRDTNFLTVESRRANAQGIIDLLTDDASSNCAKASVLLPILLWLTSIQARHDALKDQGESFAPDIEELDDIFVAIAEEYQTLHLTK